MWMKNVSKIILLSVTLAGALVPGAAAQSPYEVHEVPLRAEGGWLVVPVVISSLSTPSGHLPAFTQS